jgi:hypothetical protein
MDINMELSILIMLFIISLFVGVMLGRYLL